MISSFVQGIKTFAVQLLVLAIVLYLLHSYLLSHLITSSQILPLWQIYLYLTIVVFLIFSWIYYKKSQGKTEVFNYFMIGTLLKMILAIVFLIPVFISEQETKRPDVFNFFIPYFIFLAFEVFVITRLINSKTE